MVGKLTKGGRKSCRHNIFFEVSVQILLVSDHIHWKKRLKLIRVECLCEIGISKEFRFRTYLLNGCCCFLPDLSC